jgi:exonuclease III
MTALLSLFLLLTSLSLHAAMTIGAYNIRNFDYDIRSQVPTNKSELSTILKSLKADVLSVEEINNVPEFEKFIPAKMPGYETAISRCGGAHGQKLGFIYNTATVSLLSFSEDLITSNPGSTGSCDAGSRPLAIGLFQIKSTKQKFYGITAHLKSGSDPEAMGTRMKQYEILKKFIINLKATSGVQDLYLAGDLNTTEYTSRGADYKALTKLVSDLGMIDLAANAGCSAYWWGGTEDGIESPSLLDHVIVTPGLRKVPSAAKVHGHCQKVSCRAATLEQLGTSYGGVSDHCPMTATIQ